jgi:hypothetical protein
LNVPKAHGAAVVAAAGRADARPASAADWLDAARNAGRGSGLVALYAAQSHQKACEDRFPEGGSYYGRLAYTFCRVLEECDRPLTYRELGQRILWRYTQNGWIHRSTPGIEGTDLSREVLGEKTWPGRSKLQLSRAGDRYTVSGGVLHGVTAGSILAVHAPAGTSNQKARLGYVRIRDAQPLSAQAEPIEFDNLSARDDLPDLARCEVVYRDLGELKVTVGVQAEGIDDETRANVLRSRVDLVLRALAAGKGSLIRLTDSAHAAQWFAVATGRGVYLQRADSNLPLDDAMGAKMGEVFGPMPVDAGLKLWLRDTLHDIARATNLRKMAEQISPSAAPLVDVELQVTRDGEPFVPADGATAQARDGEVLELHIRNTGRKAVSLAVFYIQNDFAIKAFFPRSDRDFLINVIDKDGSLTKPVKFRINDRTLGWEDIIVIAVDAKDRNAIDDILLLQQAGFASRTRSGGPPPRAFRSALGRLIDSAMNGGTRGLDRLAAPVLDSYAIRRISWNVVAIP